MWLDISHTILIIGEGSCKIESESNQLTHCCLVNYLHGYSYKIMLYMITNHTLSLNIAMQLILFILGPYTSAYTRTKDILKNSWSRSLYINPGLVILSLIIFQMGLYSASYSYSYICMVTWHKEACVDNRCENNRCFTQWYYLYMYSSSYNTIALYS